MMKTTSWSLIENSGQFWIEEKSSKSFLFTDLRISHWLPTASAKNSHRNCRDREAEVEREKTHFARNKWVREQAMANKSFAIGRNGTANSNDMNDFAFRWFFYDSFHTYLRRTWFAGFLYCSYFDFSSGEKNEHSFTGKQRKIINCVSNRHFSYCR